MSLALFLFNTGAHAQTSDGRRGYAVIPTPQAMSFLYEDYDGSFAYSCTSQFLQTPKDNPYDFVVKCYDKQQVLKRTFSVHLAITVYAMESAPKTKIEILYWVNQNGATSWINLSDASPSLYSYESSQAIQGEASDLRIKLQIARP